MLIKLKLKKALSVFLIMLLAVSALSGCTNNGSKPKDSQETTTEAKKDGSSEAASEGAADNKYGGTITFALDADPKNINYVASMGDNIDGQIKQATSDYRALYNPETGEYEGRLLESWEMSEDAKEWTMHIRPGVKWHDGTPFTAEDVIFTYNYYADPDFDIPDPEIMLIPERYEIIDELTYKVITDEPNPSELADWTIFIPKHIWENVDPKDFANAPEGRLMVGTGPFKMAEYKVGEYIRFEAFEDYYGGKPYADEIIYRIIPDKTAQAAALESGQIDFLTSDALSAEKLLSNPDIVSSTSSSGNVARLYVNFSREPFNDLKFRQAIAHLIKRDVLISQAMRGFADEAYSDFSPIDFYYVDDPFKQYEFDTEKAKSLLEEMGYTPGKDGIMEKDGLRLEFEVFIPQTFASYFEPAVLIMAPDFLKAGIKISPRIIDKATNAQLWETHEFDMLINGTTMGPDPMRYQQIFANPENVMLYEDADMIELFENAVSTFDPAASKDIYEDIQYELANDVSNIPLWYRYTVYAYNKNIAVDEAVPLGNIFFRILHMDKLYIQK